MLCELKPRLFPLSASFHRTVRKLSLAPAWDYSEERISMASHMQKEKKRSWDEVADAVGWERDRKAQLLMTLWCFRFISSVLRATSNKAFEHMHFSLPPYLVINLSVSACDRETHAETRTSDFFCKYHISHFVLKGRYHLFMMFCSVTEQFKALLAL